MSIVGLSSQSPRFSPNDLPGLSLWLDAADATTVTRSGSNVTIWEDKSGLQNRAVSRDGFPTYTASGINGRPAVTFSNAPSMAGNLSITGTTVTGFLVIQGSQSGSGRNDQRILSCAASGAADWNSTARFLVGIQGGGTVVRYNRGNTYIPQTSIAIGSPVLLSWLSDGTSNFIWEDGVAGDTLASVANGDSFSITNYALGNQFTTTTETYNGLIGEVLVYTTPLSTDQRQQVEAYLGTKWGLVTITGHPYRAGAPGILPTSIPGCSFWLDAADASSMTLSGTNLTQWRDKSSNAFVGTAQGSPALATVAGVQSVTFNGSSQWIDFGNVGNFGTNPLNIFTVCTFNNTSPNYVIAKTRYASWQYRWQFGRENGNLYGSVQAEATGAGFGTGAAVADTATNRRVLGYTWDRSTMQFFINGRVVGTNTLVNTSNFTQTNNLLVGAINNTSGGVPPQDGFRMNGSINEIVMVYAPLTTLQRQQIEGYLAHKWGLASDLPEPTLPYARSIIPMRAFSPSDIGGLALWLDAADATTLTLTGTDVSSWSDKSGNGRNATTGTGSVPLSTSLNGQATLRFNPSNTLNISNVSLTQSQTSVFWVLRGVTAPASGAYGYFVFSRVGDDGGWNSSNQGFFAVYGNPSSTSYYLAATGGGTGSQEQQYSSSGSNPFYPGASLATIFGVNGAWLNGTSLPIAYAQPISNTLLNTNLTYQLGVTRAGSGNYAFDLAELVVYDTGALSTVQRQQIETYLAAKWGLRGSMGGTAHPYRYGPPVIGTPATFLPNLRLWLDAADSNAYTLSGSNVTAVLDKSSNAWSLGTAANVTLNSTRFNTTYPSFYSTGANLGSNTSFAIQQPLTVYFAGQSLNTWGSAYLFDSINSSSRVAMNSGALFFAGSADVLPTNNSESLSPHVFCVTYNGSNSSIVLNGTTTTGNPGSQGFNGIILSKGDGYRGHICELLIYSGTHTTAQVQSMMGYLAWKWGIPGRLPGVSTNYGRIGRALTPLFTPTQIVGCALWLDGADTGTQTFNGSTLTRWRDKGSAYTMDTVAPNCSLPVRGTAINGLSTIGITTGSMGIKQSSVINGVKNVFWVRRENGGNQGYQFYFGSDGNADFHTGDQGQFAHGGISPAGVRDASLTLFRSSGVTSGRLAAIEFPPGGGTLNLVSISNMTGDTRIQGISYDRGNTGRSITCDWGELLLYTTAVPAADIKRVEGYLAWKWGLQSFLPTGHPFKAVKP